MRVAGIMSGTSLDGIDVAIVDIGARERIRTRAFHSTAYPERVREALLGVSNTNTHTATISRLNFLLGELYAKAVIDTCERSRIAVDSLDLIGCHGQTIYHEGQPGHYLRYEVANTLQIGEPAVLAERTGITVVSNFRTRDIAAGGKGAPLVPYVDYLLYRHARRGRVALNIGGIANLTAIPAGGKPGEVVAFDTGPGNMVIDALVARHTDGRHKYDAGGRLAAKGKVDPHLLRELLDSPYYRAKPPKTAGREEYGGEFIERLLASGLSLLDLIATATALTAAAVALAIDRFVRPRMDVDDLIVSGGGAHNPQIMAELAKALPLVTICTSGDFGVDVDAKEAIAFALLAYRSARTLPANLPSATGAGHPVVLGSITPGNKSGRRRVV